MAIDFEYPEHIKIVAEAQAHFIRHFAPDDPYERDQFHRELAYLIQVCMRQAAEPFMKRLGSYMTFQLPEPGTVKK